MLKRAKHQHRERDQRRHKTNAVADTVGDFFSQRLRPMPADRYVCHPISPVLASRLPLRDSLEIYPGPAEPASFSCQATPARRPLSPAGLPRHTLPSMIHSSRVVLVCTVACGGMLSPRTQAAAPAPPGEHLAISGSPAQPTGLDAVARADSLYYAGRPADALAACDSLLSRSPNDFDVLWRASRAALALGILSDRQDAQNPMYLRAEALARRAIQRNAERAEGYYWLAAAMGRRALHADLRTTARLASEVAESATRALAIDSTHAGAHDVMGKLHSEVRKLPYVVRFIAGQLLGISVVRLSSWELAEQHLRRAVALDSTSILYRVDLAQMYLRTRRAEKAEPLLREALAMRRQQPPDVVFQREALALLAECRSAQSLK
jgi:tetratricopeptide (TPR) repeat protein